MSRSYLKPDRKLKRLLQVMLCISVFVHIAIFIGLPKAPSPMIHIEESTEIEVELGSIGDDVDDNIAAIKDTKVAESATVPDNMLPQIARNMEVKQPEPKETSDNEDDKEPLKEQVKDEKSPEKEANTKTKDSSENDKRDPPSNPIDKAELQKRLALEKLKALANTGKELQTQNNQSNRVNIKDKDADKKMKTSGESISPQVARACNSMVRKLMRNYYSLPANYYIEKQSIQVQVDTKIDGKGNVTSTKIAKSSGDSAFDGIVQKAITQASPFPDVCFPYAGSTMELVFSPQGL